MNDLDLMEKFRADVPAADPATLARARARMFNEEPARKPARWVWRLAPATALAAAAAVTIVAVQADKPVTPAPPTAAGSAPASAPSDAAQVFRLAADEARSEPVLSARSDQFVYVRSQVSWAGVNLGSSGPGTYIPPAAKNRQIWLSVDGSRTGELREKFLKPGQHSDIPLNNLPIDGMSAAYLQDLPTTAKAMRDYLYSHGTGERVAPDVRAFTEVGDLLREKYVPPASLAVVFEAAATIPGTTVVRNQIDAAGRHGTAVSLTDRGIRHDLIFDATTYRLLGERDVAVGAKPFPRNAVIGYTAQLKIAIVDRPGQLP
jgi:hypothetical protein